MLVLLSHMLAVISPSQSYVINAPKFSQTIQFQTKLENFSAPVDISPKKGKFLDVFQVVYIENGVCKTVSDLEGICLHSYECIGRGGVSMGECGGGYGVCCVTTCGEKTSHKSLWFINPGYPAVSEEQLSCSLTVEKSSPAVKQILLEFLYFEINPPNDGTCERDQFVISGQNRNSPVPIMCGLNDGQHLYVDVSDVDGPVYLSLQTESEGARMFAIQILQLETSSEDIAPDGCLQYHTEASGFIESFNYQEIGSIITNTVPSYLNNLNYAICIKRAPNTCSITYSNFGIFQIPNYDRDGFETIPEGQAGVEIFNCPNDWILLSSLRFCGDRLNDASVIPDFTLDAPVTDSSVGPLIVKVMSDAKVVGRGFHINYIQNSCINE